MTGADALIAVTPVFSGSCSGPFKTFFDVIDRDALDGRPVLLGATANGGALPGHVTARKPPTGQGYNPCLPNLASGR